MKTLTAISIEESLLREVDFKRGLIPRSRYIARIIDNHLKKQREAQFLTLDHSLNTPIGIDDIE